METTQGISGGREGAILARLIRAEDDNLPAEAARALLNIRFGRAPRCRRLRSGGRHSNFTGALRIGHSSAVRSAGVFHWAAPYPTAAIRLNQVKWWGRPLAK
jgi:hypothetical protein